MTVATSDPVTRAGAPALALVAGSADGPAPVPCAARPSTGFLHRDGSCRCFAGGPAPEFAPSGLATPRVHLTLAEQVSPSR